MTTCVKMTHKLDKQREINEKKIKAELKELKRLGDNANGITYAPAPPPKKPGIDIVINTEEDRTSSRFHDKITELLSWDEVLDIVKKIVDFDKDLDEETGDPDEETEDPDKEKKKLKKKPNRKSSKKRPRFSQKKPVNIKTLNKNKEKQEDKK
jgi:hypothetical protein